jgi:hypothetical protein
MASVKSCHFLADELADAIGRLDAGRGRRESFFSIRGSFFSSESEDEVGYAISSAFLPCGVAEFILVMKHATNDIKGSSWRQAWVPDPQRS